MASGIEHRSVDAVLDCYQGGGLPNFSIWAGPNLRIKYESADESDGYNILNNFLNTIQQANTNTIYTIKFYKADTTNINNKTPYEGSTTFMLNEKTPVMKDPATGLMLIDRTTNTMGSTNQGFTQIMQMMQNMQQEQNKILQQMMEMQNKREASKLDTFIGMVTDKWNQAAQEPEKDIVDKIGEILKEQPNIVKDTFSGIGDLLRVFVPGKPGYDQIQTPSQISGTTVHAAPAAAAEQQQEETNMDTLNLYTTMPTKKEAAEQRELTEAEMDALADRDDVSLEKLDEWLGPENTSDFLESLTNGTQEQFNDWMKMQNLLTQVINKIGADNMMSALEKMAGMNYLELLALKAKL